MKAMLRRLLNRSGYDVVRRAHANTEIADHLRNVFDRYRIECVIDVGANVGQYGQMLRGLGFTGHIVSFEPVPAVFAQLVAAARGDPRWHCHPVALGSADERRTINVFASSVFSSFHAASDYSKTIWTGLLDPKPQAVDVRRLDAMADAIAETTGASRYFLKLDTQGHDLEAFRGAQAMLGRIEAMQSELSLIPVYDQAAPPYEVLAAFHEAGYWISGMYPINRDESLAVVEYDCVLVKRRA